MQNERKAVIARRYYPTYYGKKNTNYSYHSYFVGESVRKGSRDYVIGTCDASARDGWVKGVNGAYAARTYDALSLLPGYMPGYPQDK